MGSEARAYTMQEVSKHTTRKDCWLAIDGKVYDVTKFLDRHPGGAEIMLRASGKDATQKFEDIGHGARARARMVTFYIGEVKDPAITAKKLFAPPRTPRRQDTAVDLILALLQFSVPLAMLGWALQNQLHA